MDVVAEGVETAGQLRILREMGCRYLQGWLFGRPVDVTRAARRAGRLRPGACSTATGGADLDTLVHTVGRVG